MRILKIKTLESKKNCWIDRRCILLHSSFQLLVDFVEKEKPFDHINWESDHYHSWAGKEIKTLYEWWTKERPNRKDPLDELPLDKYPKREFKEIEHSGEKCYGLLDHDHNKYAEYDQASHMSSLLDAWWAKEDQEMLIRLVLIREYLWT